MNHISYVKSLPFTESLYVEVAVYIVFLFVNMSLTLVHFIKELKGLQWRYLGAIVGLQIPDKAGIVSFFALPLAGLCVLGFIGIAPLHVCGWVSSKATIASVAAIIGTRLSDSLHIHIRPHRQGYRPNPALGTIPYYLAEAVWLTILFLPGIWNHFIYALLGFAGGYAFFRVVLPGLHFVRTFRHHEPWQRGRPIPSWAKEENYKTRG